jgi:hypothetical protein
MDRRSARVGLTVAHRHRIDGGKPVSMVSELTFVGGLPKAILAWIDLGGVRTPICIDLDPARLIAPAGQTRGRCHYTGTTFDPRTEDVV